MPSKSKNDCCGDRSNLALSSVYQECPVTFKLMRSQVVERARPLSSHIGPLGRESEGLVQLYPSISISDFRLVESSIERLYRCCVIWRCALQSQI